VVMGEYCVCRKNSQSEVVYYGVVDGDDEDCECKDWRRCTWTARLRERAQYEVTHPGNVVLVEDG
jgi:hypothetical protein